MVGLRSLSRFALLAVAAADVANTSAGGNDTSAGGAGAGAGGEESVDRGEVCMHILDSWYPAGCKVFEEEEPAPLGSRDLAMRCSNYLSLYVDCLLEKANATDSAEDKAYYMGRADEPKWLGNKLQSAIESMTSAWCPELWELNHESWDEGCSHSFSGQVPGWAFEAIVHDACGDKGNSSSSSSNSSTGSSGSSSGRIVEMEFRRSGVDSWCQTDADCGDILCHTKCVSVCTDCETPMACVPVNWNDTDCTKREKAWIPEPSSFLSKCPVRKSSDHCWPKIEPMFEAANCKDVPGEDAAGKAWAKPCKDVFLAYDECIEEALGSDDKAYTRSRSVPGSYYTHLDELLAWTPGPTRKCVNIPAFQAEAMKVLPCDV